MKIITYISMILAFCTKFMLLWKPVIVCGCDYRKYGCLIKDSYIFSRLKPPATPSLLVRYGIHLPFKYASDFIWVLGKNNLSMLMAPVTAFFSSGAGTHKDSLLVRLFRES
jgi:hypothetical protein